MPNLKGDSLNLKTTKSLKVDFNRPTKNFVEFTAELEEKGWFFDTERFGVLSSYSNLAKNGELTFFDKKAFYKINYKDTDVCDAKKYTDEYEYPEYFEDFNFELKDKIESIWAYFYRTEKLGNSIEDGIIEQLSLIHI